MLKKVYTILLIILAIMIAKYTLKGIIDYSNGLQLQTCMNFNKENVPLPETAYEKVDLHTCFSCFSCTPLEDLLHDVNYYFKFYF